MDNPELQYMDPPSVPLTRENLEKQYEELIHKEQQNSVLKPDELLALMNDWVRQEDEYGFKLQEALDRIHIKNSLPKESAPIQDNIGNPDYFLLRHRPLTPTQKQLISSWDEFYTS